MSTKKRVSRYIKDKQEVDFFLSLKEEDITKTFIMENFGEFNGKVKYHPWDLIDIPAGAYGNEEYMNDKPFTTTVGEWVFNKYFIEKDLIHVFGYVVGEITKKKHGQLNQQLSWARLEDDITLEQFKRFLMKTQQFMPYITILSPNQSSNLVKLAKIMEPKKKELFKKYDKELKEGNFAVAEQMEKELLDGVKEVLKDDDVWDIIDSGARISFTNHIKNMYLMKGAIRDEITGKYNVMQSCYADGVSKEEYKTLCNSLAAGPYARARKTAIGGYWEKLVVSAYQHVQIQKQGTDCGTKRTLEVDFSKENIKDYMYSYIVEGNNLVELTSKNKNKYDGKKVRIRFSSLCESKNGYCSKCMGNLLYRLNQEDENGVQNVGMTLSVLASTLKNISMKSFHETLITTYTINPDDVF